MQHDVASSATTVRGRNFDIVRSPRIMIGITPRAVGRGA
jgi:hypothetical protein